MLKIKRLVQAILFLLSFSYTVNAQEKGYILCVVESYHPSSISERFFWLPDSVKFNPLYAKLSVLQPERYIGSEIFLLDLNGYDIDWKKGKMKSMNKGNVKVTYSMFSASAEYEILLMRIEEYENLYVSSSVYSRAPKIGNNKLFTEIVFVKRLTKIQILTSDEKAIFY